MTDYDTIHRQLLAAQSVVADLELQLADLDRTMPNPDAVCNLCSPHDCDDPDRHLGVPSYYTPLKNRGCHCGADFDGRDCMCFEGD